jgi:hypothetical protein
MDSPNLLTLAVLAATPAAAQQATEPRPPAASRSMR